jgi:hypothetical protein
VTPLHTSVAWCYTLVEMSRNLEDVLAALPDEELAPMRKRANNDLSNAREALQRAQVELDLIDRAIARKARKGQGPGNATREAVQAAFSDGRELTPAEVIEAVQAIGITVKDGAIRAMIRRLAEEKELDKLPHGRYRGASGVTEAEPDAVDESDFEWAEDETKEREERSARSEGIVIE